MSPTVSRQLAWAGTCRIARPIVVLLGLLQRAMSQRAGSTIAEVRVCHAIYVPGLMLWSI
jgi:hypothetical protein